MLSQRYFQKLLLTIHTILFYNFIHRYSQSNGYTPKLRLTTRLFPVLSTSVVCRNCILQVVKRCLFFIWCFFKRNCFATPSFNTVGFAQIDYVRNAIGISMMYQSDKHIASCSCATPWQSFDDIVTAKSKGEQLKTEIRLHFLFNAMRFRAEKRIFSKIVSRVTL